MPGNRKATGDGPPLERLQDHVKRLTDHPSGVVDLAYALTEPLGPNDEQACVACQRSLPEYVDAELNGQPVRRLFPIVARHLNICLDCGQTYTDLLEIALQTEAEPLPVPATAPDLDLSFLPWLRPFEQIRSVVETLVNGLAREWADAQTDLAWATSEFFSRVQALGPGVRLRPARELVLGYGGELPPALQLLAATYSATCTIVYELSAEELVDELGGDRPARALKKQARISARDAGLGRRESQRWAEQYVDLVRLHADEIVDAAQLIRQDERPDEHG